MINSTKQTIGAKDYILEKWGKDIQYDLLRKILAWIEDYENTDMIYNTAAKNLKNFIEGYDKKAWQVLIIDKNAHVLHKFTSNRERCLIVQSAINRYYMWNTVLQDNKFVYVKNVIK